MKLFLALLLAFTASAQSIPGSFRVTGFVAPPATNSNFGATLPVYGTGGLLTGLSSLSQLQDTNRYPIARRHAGQVARLTTGAEYTLGSDLLSWYNSGSVSNMAQLRSIEPGADGGVVFVNSYYGTNAVGGGSYFLTNSVTGTNLLGGQILASGGAKSWVVMQDDKISPIQFGAIPDDLVDDTANFQAAIQFVESRPAQPLIEVPSGEYLLSTLTIKSAAIHSASYGQDSSLAATPLVTARFKQKTGATNDMLIIAPTANPVPSLRGLELVGQREQNLKNPITITAVSSRTNFTVGSTNLIPAAPASPSVFPYYGYAFFFSNEDRYIGSGLVDAINYGTGEISIIAGTDNYATRTNVSYVLEPGFKVCFSENATESSSFKTTTGRDSTTAGYNAINIKSTNPSFTISTVELSDIYIRKFHTGIRLGNALYHRLNRIRCNTTTFAGVASAFPGDSRDSMLDQCIFQGFYVQNSESGQSAETNVWDNAIYRRTVWGYYGVESAGNVDSVTCDHTVYGAFVQNCLETRITTFLVDNPAVAGIVFGSGGSSTPRPQTEWLSLQIRNGNEASLVPVTSNPFYAIDSWGNSSTFYIHGLSVLRFGSDRFFTACFNIPYSVQSEVGALYAADGAVSSLIFSTNTIASAFPLIHNYRINQTQVAKYVGSTNVLNLTPTTLTTPNNILMSGAGNLTVGNGKQIFYGTGFTGIDSTGLFYIFGADQSTGTNRTDLGDKAFRFRVPSATNADPDVTAVFAASNVSGNALFLGGGDPSGQPMQNFRVYTGPQGTGSGTNHFSVGSTGGIAAPGSLTVGGGVSITGGNLTIADPTASRLTTYSTNGTSGLIVTISGAQNFMFRLVDEYGNTRHTFTTNGVYQLTSAGYIEYGSGGPIDGSGSGAPSASWPNGSTWRRTDGTGPNFYVRENGAWVAK